MIEKLKEKPSPDISLFRPRGYHIEWKDFMPFFSADEPARSLRKNPRPQRRIFIYEIKGKEWHIKKMSYFMSKRTRDRFRGFTFLKNGAETQFEKAAAVRNTGVGTVFPFFSLVQKKGFKKQGLFITPYIKLPLLHQLFISSPGSAKQKLKLFGKYIEDIKKMHQKKISHGDAHASNILADGENLLWSDFDMMRKGCIYLNLKGREYDLFRALTSVAGPLIKVGGWNKELKYAFWDELERRYPGYLKIKKRIKHRLKKRYSEY